MAAVPEPFLWEPGRGVRAPALDRMKQAFGKPVEPMGEAWFMGAERRVYPELMAEPGLISAQSLFWALREIASGTSSFGPFEEWRDWFHYLLPTLVTRSHERWVHPLLEPTITAFITQHPAGLDEAPYRGFRDDALNTLGRCLMDSVCWPGGTLDVDVCLDKQRMPSGLWRWFDASGALSASMFFCLKYLLPEEVEPWLESVLRIEAPPWRAQVMVWLIGAHRVLKGEVTSPAAFTRSDYPRMDWEESHVLSGRYVGGYPPQGEPTIFIRPSNREAALSVVSRHFKDAVFMEWLDSFAADPTVEDELAGMPLCFYDLYR